MQTMITVDPEYAALLQDLAQYLGTTPEKLMHTIMDFFIERGRIAEFSLKAKTT